MSACVGWPGPLRSSYLPQRACSTAAQAHSRCFCCGYALPDTLNPRGPCSAATPPPLPDGHPLRPSPPVPHTRRRRRAAAAASLFTYALVDGGLQRLRLRRDLHAQHKVARLGAGRRGGLRGEEHETEGIVRRPLDLRRRGQQRRIEDEAPHLLGERGEMPPLTMGAKAASEPPWEEAPLCHAPGSDAPMGRPTQGRCMAGEARPAQGGPLVTCQRTFSTRITSRALDSSSPPPLGISSFTCTWRDAA